MKKIVSFLIFACFTTNSTQAQNKQVAVGVNLIETQTYTADEF